MVTLDLDGAIERGVNKALNRPLENLGGRSVYELLTEWHSGRIAAVVRCKDCRYCKPLSITPGFYCERMDMDFYAPHYDAEKWYCGDGMPREVTTTDKRRANHGAKD